MRTALSVFLAAVAVLATIVAVPSLWARQALVSKDGFVQTVAPLAESAGMQDIVADEIATQIAANTQLPKALALPFAKAYTAGPDFPDDFRQTAAQQHDWLFLEPQPGTDQQPMSLDFTAMANRALDKYGHGLAPQLADGTLRVTIGRSSGGLEAGAFRAFGGQISLLAFGLTGLAILAALGALVAARRRFLMGMFLGLGVVVAGLIGFAASVVLRGALEQQVGGADGTARQVATLIVDRLVSDLDETALYTAGAGAIIAVLALVGHLALGRTAAR